MVCSKTCNDIAYVALLMKSKLLIYSFTTEEDDTEEDESPTFKSAFLALEKTKSKIVVSK